MSQEIATKTLEIQLNHMMSPKKIARGSSMKLLKKFCVGTNMNIKVKAVPSPDVHPQLDLASLPMLLPRKTAEPLKQDLHQAGQDLALM